MDKIHLMVKGIRWYAGRIPEPPKGNRHTAPKLVGRGIPEMVGWAQRQKRAVEAMLPVVNQEYAAQLAKAFLGQPKRRKEGNMYPVDKAVRKVLYNNVMHFEIQEFKDDQGELLKEPIIVDHGRVVGPKNEPWPKFPPDKPNHIQ